MVIFNAVVSGSQIAAALADDTEELAEFIGELSAILKTNRKHQILSELRDYLEDRGFLKEAQDLGGLFSALKAED